MGQILSGYMNGPVRPNRRMPFANHSRHARERDQNVELTGRNFYGKSLTDQRAMAVPIQILKPIDTLYFIPLNFLPVASTF